jgi:hypothetical protein
MDNMEKFQTNSDIRSISTTFMFQILTSVNTKKEFTILELQYLIIFHILLNVQIMIWKCLIQH